MSEDYNAEMIRKFFEETRLRKYNIKVIIRFLEENIYETFITPKFDIVNDYKEFSKDFDNCLNDLSSNAKEILIKKYGMVDGVSKTAAEIAFNNKLSIDGVSTSVRNSIFYLKNSNKIDNLKKYFIMQDFDIDDEEKKLETIKYILELAKQLEGNGENND